MRRLPYPGAASGAELSRQARSGIEPSRAWQAGRGNSLTRVHITGRYAARPQSLRCASLGGSAPRNTRYVPRAPGPALRPAAGPPQPKTGGCCGRGCAATAMHLWPGASRRAWSGTPARPGRLLRPGFSPAGFTPRARSRPPVRPRQAGAPQHEHEQPSSQPRTAKQPVQRVEGRTATTERASRHWPPRLAPCSPRQGFAVPACGRP